MAFDRVKAVEKRLVQCQGSRDEWKEQFLLVNDKLDDELAKNLDLVARLRVSDARVVTLDSARLAAISRLKNV